MGLHLRMMNRTYGDGIVMMSLLAQFPVSDAVLKLRYTIFFIRK